MDRFTLKVLIYCCYQLFIALVAMRTLSVQGFLYSFPISAVSPLLASELPPPPAPPSVPFIHTMRLIAFPGVQSQQWDTLNGAPTLGCVFVCRFMHQWCVFVCACLSAYHGQTPLLPVRGCEWCSVARRYQVSSPAIKAGASLLMRHGEKWPGIKSDTRSVSRYQRAYVRGKNKMYSSCTVVKPMNYSGQQWCSFFNLFYVILWPPQCDQCRFWSHWGSKLQESWCVSSWHKTQQSTPLAVQSDIKGRGGSATLVSTVLSVALLSTRQIDTPPCGQRWNFYIEGLYRCCKVRNTTFYHRLCCSSS